MLLILDPRSPILFLIRILHGACAMFAAPFELSSVHLAIFFIDFSSKTFHISVAKLSCVGFFEVGEVVGALTIKDTISEVALVIATIGPFIAPFAALFTVSEVACVFRFVRVPGLNALTVLAVILPLTFIHVSIEIRKGPPSIGFVVKPVTFVHVASWVDEPAIALALATYPHALIHRTICILYRAQAVLYNFTSTQSCYNDETASIQITCAIDVTEFEKLVDFELHFWDREGLL